MLIAITLITAASILINFALYKFYRRGLAIELEAARRRLALIETVNLNLHSYCDSLEAENSSLIRYEDELHARCERYRQAMLTEALAARMRAEPAARVHIIQRKNGVWLIDSNVN